MGSFRWFVTDVISAMAASGTVSKGLSSACRRWGPTLLGGLLAGMVLWPSLLWAQPTPSDSLSLAERYRNARVRMLVQEYLSEHKYLPVRPPRPLPVRVEFLREPAQDSTTEPESRNEFSITQVRRVRDLERGWFREEYGEVDWSFLGAGTRLSFFDTTRTRDLRARLQSEFGDPTRTLSEIYSREWRRAPDSTREDPIQFAYWFVVNDSIPVRVSDVNGPSERGVIVSTSRQHRRELVGLRAALLEPLRRGDRAPYVDYYYEEETRRWYRVGFDGRDFFRERVSRFDITPGRRPRLDTSRTSSSSSR